MKGLLANASVVLAAASDPISDAINQNWAGVTGWSLFVGLGMLIIVGAFRELWVPGNRYRKLEETVKALEKANDKLTTQNGQLITANEITKYFFQQTTPKKGDVE
jgi:hypothetical protein